TGTDGGPGRQSGGGLLGGEIGGEQDLAPRERWRAPFAVSSLGTVRPIEARTVIVLSADPAIAAGLAEQRAVELGGGDGRGGAAGVTGGEASASDATGVAEGQPASAGGGAGGSGGGLQPAAGPDSGGDSDSAPRPDPRTMMPPSPGS